MPKLTVDQYRLAILAMAGFCAVVASAVLGSGLIWQLWLLVPLVAVLGLPHGCLDVAIAQRLKPLPTIPSMAVFVAVYLALASLVLGLWMVLPGVALALFLGYSALHFAGDWRAVLPGLKSLPAGLAIVAIPAVAYQSETAVLFGYLAPEEWASRLVDAMVLIALLMAPLAVFLQIAARASKAIVGEFVALMALGLLTPPLVYFTLYFCLAHSPKHLFETTKELGLCARETLYRALPIWLVTMVGAVAAFTLIDGAPEAATLQIIFIGLAALTVPHMLLVEALWSKQST